MAGDTGAAPKAWQGRYFEDFDVGDVFRSRFGRTVTDYDNLIFTALTHNTNSIHFDAAHAERTQFGRILVPSVGIVSMRCRGINQRGQVVVEYRRTFMVYKRMAPEAERSFPGTREEWRV